MEEDREMINGQSCVVGEVKRVAHVQCRDGNATNINLSLSFFLPLIALVQHQN